VVLLDLNSRGVVGWAMSDRIDTELALGALQMVGATRALEADRIHHTDRDRGRSPCALCKAGSRHAKT